MADMLRTVSFVVNGAPVTLQVDPTARLVDVLRNELGLTGTKEGCGVGECGACTVLLNGKAVTSCSVLAGQAEGKEIMTIEGMEHTQLGRVLQQCFVEESAIQCGFCTPGMILSAYALLMEHLTPTRDEIRVGMSGNLCRCTGYVPIINAIQAAAAQMEKHRNAG